MSAYKIQMLGNYPEESIQEKGILFFFFWVHPHPLNFMCRHFGTLCLLLVHHLWRWNRQSIVKSRHINFRCRGFTQKKEYKKRVLYSFFWVHSDPLNFMCRHFGTLCLLLVHLLWRWNRQSIVKSRHINFRCRGFTQKKEYNKERVTMSLTLNMVMKQIVTGWTCALMRRLAGWMQNFGVKSFEILLNNILPEIFWSESGKRWYI